MNHPPLRVDQQAVTTPESPAPQTRRKVKLGTPTLPHQITFE